jgi:threonine/homoserine/homoserine lactone efflux protein
MLAPGMLNMTSVKIRLERGKFNAVKFALGVSTIVLVQAYAAVFFTNFLKENPDFIQVLQKIAIVIFSLLSLHFYREFRKEKKTRTEFAQKCKDTFVIGLFLSAFNMFAIPFYYGITILLDNFGWLHLSKNNISLFVIGSAIGTFMLLYAYSGMVNYLRINSDRTSNKLNLALSVLTGALAIITLIKLY